MELERGAASQGAAPTPIDIILPVHGNVELTQKCVNTIYNHTKVPFHLIILDDTEASAIYGSRSPIASTETVHQYLRALTPLRSNITYVSPSMPYRCGNEMFEDGFSHCQTDYVATVMNSTLVEPEWETVALELMTEDPKIGVIGFKCLFPHGIVNGGLIESAGIFFHNYMPCDFGRDLPGHRCTEVVEVVACQWAFALLRRKACQGNLDLTSYNGFVGWDDIDNCMEVKKRGWKILYCGYGVGYHYPRATRGSDDMESHRENKENAHTFYTKWGLWNQYQEAINTMDVSSRLKDETKKTISATVLEAQILTGIVNRLNGQLSEMGKKALEELNVSSEDYALQVNPMAGTWNIVPKKLPEPPPLKTPLRQLEEKVEVLA